MNLHPESLELIDLPVSGFEAAMVLKQSDSPASLQLSSQRKRDLLDHYETNVEELDRWRKFNAAYHEDDLKFMRFLIPPGKRVLELGCGRGDLLAALSRPMASGSISAPRPSPAPGSYIPNLNFVLGDVEDPATLAANRGTVRLHRDRRHHRHVRGYRWHLAAGAASLRAIDADHHLLLLAFVGAGAQARRSCCICGASNRRSTTSPRPTSSI